MYLFFPFDMGSQFGCLVYDRTGAFRGMNLS